MKARTPPKMPNGGTGSRKSGGAPPQPGAKSAGPVPSIPTDPSQVAQRPTTGMAPPLTKQTGMGLPYDPSRFSDPAPTHLRPQTGAKGGPVPSMPPGFKTKGAPPQMGPQNRSQLAGIDMMRRGGRSNQQ